MKYFCLNNNENNNKNPNINEDPNNFNKKNFQSEDEEFQENKNRIYLFSIGSVSLICIYLLYKMNWLQENQKKSKNRIIKHKGVPDIGGNWELIGPDNKVFGSEELKDKYYLIYFGFCNCPDICPQTMTKMSKALDLIKQMPEKKYFDLEYVFVSVDPDRDNQVKMKKFCNNFHKDIIPVTGKNNKDINLRNMMKKFRIYASKIEIEDEEGKKSDNYYLDHTIITYLISKDNTYLSHIGGSMNSSDIANYVVEKVMEHEKSY